MSEQAGVMVNVNNTAVHDMPFGPRYQAEAGQWCFRLWAPQAQSVQLIVYGVEGEQRVSMDAQVSESGWFEGVTDCIQPGMSYHFEIDGELRVPDPVSRQQADDVHGPSVLMEPNAYCWDEAVSRDWTGRPWHEAVFYELHIGTFTPEGTFRGAIDRLDYLKELGVTAIELMPVSDFPGPFNWGYDGVLLFAPDTRYGSADDLKALIDAAHQRGIMVFLDVVYNHFGPEGNYLYVYAKDFFNTKKKTPWGDALNFDGKNSHWVREFFIHNALYWLEEYRFDGLRLDAVHEILDSSPTLAHMARHLFAFSDPTWSRTPADGTRTAFPTFGAVGCTTTTKIPTLHDALKASALGRSNDINKISSAETVFHLNHISGLHIKSEITEFTNSFEPRCLVFGVMPKLWLTQPLVLLWIKSQLNRTVTIAFGCLALNNVIGTTLDYSDMQGTAVAGIYPCLSQFFTK